MPEPLDFTKCQLTLARAANIDDIWALIEAAIREGKQNLDPGYLKDLRGSFSVGASSCLNIVIDILCKYKVNKEFSEALLDFANTVAKFSEESTYPKGAANV